MQAALATKIEDNVIRAACASFGAACAIAAYVWLSASLAQPTLGAYAGGAGALAYLCCGRVLAALVGNSERMATPPFELRHYEAPELEELLLTERVQPDAGDALVLDDILEQLGPDSRVVRLFDRSAMPTPAELKSRIDDHLGRSAGDAESSDASQALHQALAELRRSIR
ncbi:MAG TPA: hypothetical protein VIL42_09965 [Sphingomicrobium sp.]|jgi:hypothetical protein